MFIKFLIFFLVGTSLVLTSPIEKPNKKISLAEKSDNKVDCKVVDKLDNWWLKLKKSTSSTYYKAVRTFDDVYEDIKSAGSYVADVDEKILFTLKKKYELLQMKAKADIEKKKSTWQLKLNELCQSKSNKNVKGQEEKATASVKMAIHHWMMKLKNFEWNLKRAFDKKNKLYDNSDKI